MNIVKTFKYRIYPTKEQKVLLSKHFGCTRFIFNYFLNKRKIDYDKVKDLKEKKVDFYQDYASLTQLKKQEEYKWLKEVNSQSSQAAIKDLDTAYKNFFSKRNKFPKFKSKKDKQSFRIPQSIKYNDRKLTIPKFKTPIKVKEDRPLEGEICFATISKNSTNQYYVAITCEVEHTPYAKNNNSIGIDLGIKNLVIGSNGQVFDNIKNTKKYSKKLAKSQRKLIRKKKNSNNRKKERLKVAKVHQKIKNCRMDHIHKITNQIVRENQTICIEDLSVKNMIKNYKLAKSISDCAWGEIIRQLQYKSKWNNRNLIVIDRFFPSSKTCNVCNHINDNLSLNDRSWTCSNCNTVLDRDLNAARNILQQGLNHSGCGMQSELKLNVPRSSIGNAVETRCLAPNQE